MNVVPLDAAGQGASFYIKLVVVCAIVFNKNQKKCKFLHFFEFLANIKGSIGQLKVKRCSTDLTRQIYEEKIDK